MDTDAWRDYLSFDGTLDEHSDINIDLGECD